MLDADVLVVGHHGSSGSSSQEFIDEIAPAVALISCGEGNDYGHPAERTMKLLEEAGILIYRTDKQGEVTCTSDGESYWFDQEPCTDYSPGEGS